MYETQMPRVAVPMPSGTIARFMSAVSELCPTGDGEAPIEMFAEHLRWPLASVVAVAEWCSDRDLIDTDAGLGDPITIIEGRYSRYNFEKRQSRPSTIDQRSSRVAGAGWDWAALHVVSEAHARVVGPISI